MRYYVEIGGRSLEVDVDADGTVRVDGQRVRVRLEEVGDGPGRLAWIDGRAMRVLTAGRRGHWTVQFGSEAVVATVEDERTRTVRELAGEGHGVGGPQQLRAPMPGLVARVNVREGDVVEAGDGLVVVEAMKMENELCAEGAGKVFRVHVTDGDTVETDQPLIDFEPTDGSDSDTTEGEPS